MISKYNVSALCFFLVLMVFSSSGQNTFLDSLIHVYPKIKEDEKRVDIINKISYLHYTVDIEKTLSYAEQALALSEKIAYAEGKGMALNLIGIYHEVNGDIEKSLALNKEVLQIGEESQNDFLISVACTNMANKYDTKGEPEKAIRLYLRSIDISEKTEDTNGLILGFANLALLYGKLEENDKAGQYFQKAKKILDQYPERAMYCWFYGVLGDWHFDNENLEKAKRCYDIALVEANKRNDKRAIVNLNSSLSELYLKLSLSENAEQCTKIAVQTAKLIGDKSLMLTTKVGLLELYEQTKQLSKIAALGPKLLEIAKENKFTTEEMKIYELLSKMYILKANYEKGYQLNQDYLRLKDSLSSENTRIEVAKIEEKYQSEKKEKENLLLRAQQTEQKILLESQRKLSIALVAIIVLISLLGILIYLAYKAQKNSREELEQKVIDRTKELSQSNTELKKSNEELERFAYITSHDLKEPLRNISGFVKLLQRKLPADSNPSINEYVSFITKGTKQMHTLIEDVLEYSKVTQKTDERTMVDLNNVLEKIRESLAGVLDEKRATIIVENDLSNQLVNPAKVYFLFKNLIENGLKYNQSNFPEIRVGSKIIKQQLCYFVADNGIGIDKKYKDTIFEMFKRLHNRGEYEGSGLGLSICKKLVEELGGKIWIDTQVENGSIFYFTLTPSYKIKTESSTQHKNISAPVTNLN